MDEIITEEYIIEHYKNPSNKGIITNPTVHNQELNHSCGDILHIYLDIDNDKIINIKWEGAGCSISQACMSILSEKVINMNICDIKKIYNIKDILKIDISNRRTKCANLSLLCLHNCINIYKGENIIGFNELFK